MPVPAVVVLAPSRTPLPFGLFSVVAFRSNGDRWESGVKWEPLTTDSAGSIGAPVWDSSTSGPTTAIGLPKNLDNDTDFGAASVFTVYGNFRCSPVGWTPEQAQARAEEQLLEREEYQAEETIWSAGLASTPTFRNSPVLGTGPTVLGIGLARLESLLASGYGSLGVIHMTRGMALLGLSRQLLVVRGTRLFTALGTPVVAGGGYDGSGPAGQSAVAGVSEWVYATSGIFGYRSDVFTSSNRPGDLLDRNVNNLYAVAERQYLVGWDPAPSGAGSTSALACVNVALAETAP